jgi:hypothetical protein
MMLPYLYSLAGWAGQVVPGCLDAALPVQSGWVGGQVVPGCHDDALPVQSGWVGGPDSPWLP